MTEGATHPDDGDMLRLLDGACEPEERRALAAHLDGCPACAARAEARRQVRQALAELNEKERSVLLMREEGFAHREIAEAVGTTTKSVGTMIARALEKLAQRLDLDREGTP